MSFLDSFMIRAALAGLGVALAAAPLGCFVVWRRMAYFGDTTAHAAILGVALALNFHVSIYAGVLAVALIVALLVTALGGRTYASDTLLGVLAHGSLAFGLVAVSFVPGARVDLTAYLFGDILAVSHADLAVIWIGAAAVMGILAWRWDALLTSTLSPDLAHAAEIDPRREQLVLTVSLALVVAIAIQVVGALLIAAMLVIPAAAARPMSRTPERMALNAAAVGACSALGGLWLSFLADTPTGPTIVCVAAVIFGATATLNLARGQSAR